MTKQASYLKAYFIRAFETQMIFPSQQRQKQAAWELETITFFGSVQ